jgi:hypothetical protein
MTDHLERQLPIEILDYVVSLTPRETLLSLCLVSRGFQTLATPHLYSHITLCADLDTGPLAYLLITSPSHACHVQSLLVSEDWTLFDDAMNERQTWTKYETAGTEDMVLRKKCMEYATTEEEVGEMCNKLKSRSNADAILALLLANLPKVQKLDINFGMPSKHEKFHSLLGMILSRVNSKNTLQLVSAQDLDNGSSALGRSAAFTVPIHIAAKGTDGEDPNASSHIVTLFQLPNLHSFYGWKFGDSESDPDENNPFLKLKRRSCSIEYIELRTSKLHKDNLQLLLGATIPGKLKTFNYEIGCMRAHCSVDHSAVMQSLAAHHHTLENLGLSHEDLYPYEGVDGDYDFDRPFPCDFSHFEALRRLKVAPVFVWGHKGLHNRAKYTERATRNMLWKTLPKSIEELWLTRAHHEEFQDSDRPPYLIPDCLLPALDSLLEYKAEAFPKLNRVIIQFDLAAWKDDWLDALALFCQRAVAMGIPDMILWVELEPRNVSDYFERAWGWNEDVVWDDCYDNMENPKRRLVATEEADLAQTLRDLKSEPVKRSEKQGDFWKF